MRALAISSRATLAATVAREAAPQRCVGIVAVDMTRDTWLGVEVRHLAALAAIDRTGSFRGAADDLGYVQSAVSQQISRLEEVIGMRLVERSRGHARVALTAAGATLLEHADAIVARLTAARTDLDRLADGEAGVVRVGLCESAATTIWPRMLSLIARRVPNLRVISHELTSWEHCREMVTCGDLDIGFDHLPLDPGPYEHVELMTCPSVLLVQAGSPLARRDAPPTLAEIARLPLVEHPAWRFAPRLRVILETAERPPRFTASSNLNRGVQSLVAEGLGAAVLPGSAVDSSCDDTVAIDLSGILPPARLVLFWHRDRLGFDLDPILAAARDACAEHSGRHEGVSPCRPATVPARRPIAAGRRPRSGDGACSR